MDDLYGLILERLISDGVAELRRRTGVDRRAGAHDSGQGKPLHVTPVWAYRLLNAVCHRDAVLGDHVLDLKRLPVVRVYHRRARLVDHKRLVNSFVIGGFVPIALVRPICLGVRKH